MWTATIDDTGVSFSSLCELAKFLGCARSNIDWYMNKTLKKNHFFYRDLGITIKKHKQNIEQRKKRSKEYYRTHTEHCKKLSKTWAHAHKDKVKNYKETWRKAHQEWFNAYYREYRKKRKQNGK